MKTAEVPQTLNGVDLNGVDQSAFIRSLLMFAIGKICDWKQGITTILILCERALRCQRRLTELGLITTGKPI